MTEEEGKDRLVYFVEKKIRDSSWFIFSGRDLKITLTRILEPYEKSANLPLPEKLTLGEIELDKSGILYRREDLLDWKDVCASGIMSEYISNGWPERGGYHKEYLLVILHSGDIIPFYIGDISHLKGLLGHFIELYKQENNSRIS
jgi:hypothetical protein